MTYVLRTSWLRTALGAATLAALAAIILNGCGDDDGPAMLPDAGPGPSDDAGRRDAGGDAGPVDFDAPTITETRPSDAATGIARDVPFEAIFSEPMQAEVGTVRVRVEGVDVDVEPTFADESTLRIEPPSGTWPAASEVEVRISADFEDLAGNPLDRAYAFRFTTADDVVPEVVSTSPAEGATDVSSRTSVIRIRFSKPMDQAMGTVTLEGGPGAIDVAGAAWSPFEVSYPVSGLVNETAYRVVLSGFADRSGNPLDGTAVLGDGAIDFTTRGDDEAPRAIGSTPTEGEVDVLLSRLGGVITVLFDEPMDTTVATAPLLVGTTSRTVTINWADDQRAEFQIDGIARIDMMHSLDLRAFTDVAGNALAPEPYLGDGRLDFSTSMDAFVPFVVASDPVEGAMNVAIPVREVVLAFSETMDTTLADVVVTDDLMRTTTVTGTWRAGGTVLALPGSAFVPGRTVHVDVTGLQDTSGTSVSSAHAYLGDGILDFSIARPTGASCAEPLLLEHASSVAGARSTFIVTSAQRTRDNGSARCDPTGPSETDAVILYRKTTPASTDPSGTGRALRIMTFDVTNRANIDVLSGVCDPRDPAAAAARQVCVTGHADWDQLLDLPAGDHYIWVSTADGSPFEVEVALEEIAPIPEGESCVDPYDTGSGTTIYTPPAMPGDPHVWTIPSATHVSVDITSTNAPFQAISCREEPFGDVVVAVPKAAADSVLDVRVQGGFTAEVITGACRADDPAATRAGCITFASPTAAQRLTATGPAGTAYVWMAGTSSSSPFAGGRLEVRELPAPSAPGSSCATAIPVTPGASVPVTPTHAARYFAPSCVPVDSNVTWYAFTTTEQLTRITTTGAGAVGVVDAASGRTAACLTDATTNPASIFAPAGTRVCVAVESASAVTALAFESIGYTGVGVTGPVSLNIDPPSLEGTPYTSILGDTWLALTPTTIWQNIGTAGIYSAPRAGGAQAVPRFDVDGAVLGDETIAIGHELFSMELSRAGSPRLFRFTDATGAWAPVVWDPGASYPENTRTITFDGTALYSVENISSTDTRLSTIWRYSRSMPGAPVVVGEVDLLYSIESLVADATWFYFSAQESATVRGIYRVRRADVAAGVATPVRIATFGSGTTMRLDDLTAPRYMYVRDDGDIHVIEAPGGPMPRVLGRIFDGDSADRAMDYDRATGTMVFFSTHEELAGEWYRFGAP